MNDREMNNIIENNRVNEKCGSETRELKEDTRTYDCEICENWVDCGKYMAQAKCPFEDKKKEVEKIKMDKWREKKLREELFPIFLDRNYCQEDELGNRNCDYGFLRCDKCHSKSAQDGFEDFVKDYKEGKLNI